MKTDVRPSTPNDIKPPGSDRLEVQRRDHDQIQRLRALSERLKEEFPLEATDRTPAGSTHSNLLFRALLVAAIVLLTFSLFNQQAEPTPIDPGLEISTTETEVRSDTGAVDSPPPAVLVQPSR